MPYLATIKPVLQISTNTAGISLNQALEAPAAPLAGKVPLISSGL
jgi:hypothetical protein